jgi:hypothetical protein
MAAHDHILQAIGKTPSIWGVGQLMTVTISNTENTDKPNSSI